ncbi:MAG: hypothetical protein IJ518_06655 [Clostridia bacterium]|nr:hypothetical protein [Clostridia bacterium]
MTKDRRQGIGLHTGLVALGGAGYTLLELAWRGRTHWSMFLVGGVCFELIGQIHGRLTHRPLALRCGLCAAAISAVELVSGCVLNLRLRLGVWDYSKMRFHILGQVCLAYSLLWLLLSGAVWPLYRACYRLLRRKRSL